MAIDERVVTLTLPQGEDLSAATVQVGMALKLVEHSASNTARVHLTDAAADNAIGVLYHKPNTSELGAGVTVGMLNGSGKLKGRAGAAITAGQILVPTTTDGEIGAVANVAGLANNQVGFGIALEDAADNQIFSFLPDKTVGNT